MTKRLILLAVLLLLAGPTLAPGVSAQRPEFPASYLRADVTTSTGFVEVPRQDSRTIGFTLNDRSGDNRQEQGFPHRYVITADVKEPGLTGWSATADPSGGLVQSGGTVHGEIEIRADPVVRERTVTVVLNVTLDGQDGNRAYATTPVQVRVAPYHDGDISVQSPIDRQSPQEARVVQFEVHNEAPYPDTYDLTITGPAGWSVNAPDQVSLMAHERALVDAIVIAPSEDNRFYYRESGLLRVSMSSANDPSAATLDENAHPVRVEGWYLPPYTLPFFPLFAVLLGAFVHRRRRVFRRGRKEKGPPRDPDLSPKKRALLAELKERDPQKYERMKAKIEAERERREELYPDHKDAQLEPLRHEDEGGGEGSQG